MLILTFDTCLNKTYVTLCDGQKIIDTKVISSTNENYHSAFLIPTIIEILKNNNLTMQDIHSIGTNIGPGSFTGIRVCTTIARIFAHQLGIQLVGVSSLEILSKINNTNKNSLIALDARKNKVYYGIYSPDNKEIQSPSSLEKEELLQLAKNDYFIITDKSISDYLNENHIKSINYEESDYNLGQYLSDLTYSKIINNKSNDFNWAELKPLYIQPPSISKPKIS